MPSLHNPSWFKHALNHGLLGLMVLQIIILPEFIFSTDIPGELTQVCVFLTVTIVNYFNFRSFRINYDPARDFGNIIKLVLVCTIVIYTGSNFEILLIDLFNPEGLPFWGNLFFLFLGVFVAAVFGVFVSAVLYAMNPGAREVEEE
ncbi:MAG: hypothetical protein Roseis2KO_52870 [Roseivirga sp.]